MESYKPKHLTVVIYSYYLPFFTETKTLDHRLCNSEKYGLNCSLHVCNVTLNKLLNLYTSVSCSVHNPLSCQTLCNSMYCSPPGSSVHGIILVRILEWVAVSFSRGSPQPRDWICLSCIGRQILYHWATREAPWEHYSAIKRNEDWHILQH